MKIAHVEGDPLGIAFNVRVFHRTQVSTLLRNQLIPVPKINSNSDLLTNGHGIENNNQISKTLNYDFGSYHNPDSDEETIYSEQDYSTDELIDNNSNTNMLHGEKINNTKNRTSTHNSTKKIVIGIQQKTFEQPMGYEADQEDEIDKLQSENIKTPMIKNGNDKICIICNKQKVRISYCDECFKKYKKQTSDLRKGKSLQY